MPLAPSVFPPCGSEIQLPPGGSLGQGGHHSIEVRSFLPVQSGCEMPHPRTANFIFNCRGGYHPPARRRDLRAEKGSTILPQKIIKEKPRSFLRGFFRKVTNSTTRLYHILPSMSIEFQKNILFIHSFVNKTYLHFIFMVLKALFAS